jgi:hypothetical protein
MKASKRHLEMLAKRGKLKTLFAPAKKAPGARQLRKDVIGRMKAGKTLAEAVADVTKDRENDQRTNERDDDLAGNVPVVADATSGETDRAQ